MHEVANEDLAEREMRLFVWCIPVAPTKWLETSLKATELAARLIDLPRGVEPNEALCPTAAIDLGRYLAGWGHDDRAGRHRSSTKRSNPRLSRILFNRS